MGDRRADAARLNKQPRPWPLAVRRARAQDEQAVLGFATSTWDGWDYIPHAWPVWLAATDGLMLVGCNPADDMPVAISRVAMLSPTEAWLEGIRVDPGMRGMDIATDMQVAEMAWAAAQGATVVRYGTGARNEASHRLGARHGFELLFDYRGYLWTLDPDIGLREPSAFDPAIRAASSAVRQELLTGLAAGGMIAAAADAAQLWSRLSVDPTFVAGKRLYEARPWAMGELTEAGFVRHVARGEVIVERRPSDTGWALAIVLREQQPGEDSSLRLALLAGNAGAAIDLVERVRAMAGRTLRFRLPDASPLRAAAHDALLAAGYQSPDWTLHLLGRPIDAAHPIPPLAPAALLMEEEPAALIKPPW